MENRPCNTCLYYSEHYLGYPFSLDKLCSNPILANDKRYPNGYTVSCVVMREKQCYCGKYGRVWKTGVE